MLFNSSKKLNWPVFATSFALVCFGIVMVYSATSMRALDQFGDSLYFAKKQTFFAIAGIFTMIAVAKTKSDLILKISPLLMIVSLLSLILLLVPGLGHTANGSTRWLNVLGSSFRFQPAEICKLVFVVYLCGYFLRKKRSIHSFKKGLLPPLFICGLTCTLLLAQPDFGSAVVVFALFLIVSFMAGARIKHLLGILAFCIPTLFLLLWTSPYRKQRLLSFLDPWGDPQNSGYQLLQSLTAFNNGHLFGRGLGNSHEKLYFLPEIHNDFIASLIAEELGFVGFTLFLALYASLFYHCVLMIPKIKNASKQLLVSGCLSLIGIQFLLNLCVITGLLPTKGLVLPLMSHGGTALITHLICIGVLLSSFSQSASSKG